MLSYLLKRFIKQPVELPKQTEVYVSPIDDLNETLNKAIEDWKSKQPKLKTTDMLDCWIERKNNPDGITWLVRLQTQRPLYEAAWYRDRKNR